LNEARERELLGEGAPGLPERINNESMHTFTTDHLFDGVHFHFAKGASIYSPLHRARPLPPGLQLRSFHRWTHALTARRSSPYKREEAAKSTAESDVRTSATKQHPCEVQHVDCSLVIMQESKHSPSNEEWSRTTPSNWTHRSQPPSESAGSNPSRSGSLSPRPSSLARPWTEYQLRHPRLRALLHAHVHLHLLVDVPLPSLTARHRRRHPLPARPDLHRPLVLPQSRPRSGHRRQWVIARRRPVADHPRSAHSQPRSGWSRVWLGVEDIGLHCARGAGSDHPLRSETDRGRAERSIRRHSLLPQSGLPAPPHRPVHYLPRILFGVLLPTSDGRDTVHAFAPNLLPLQRRKWRLRPRPRLRLLADRYLGRFNVLILSLAASGIVVFCIIAVLPLRGSATTAPLFGLSSTYGFLTGTFFALQATVVCSVCDEPARLGTWIGQLYGVILLPALFGPPITSQLIQRHGFAAAWSRSGAVILAGTVFMALSRLSVERRLWKVI